MTLDQLRILAQDLMQRFGIIEKGWVFKVDYKTKGKRLGQCRYSRKEIGVSAWYAETASDPSVEDTIRHEIAHVLANIEFGERGHGPTWKAMCKRVGARPDRLAATDKYVARGRWSAVCPTCKTKYCKERPPGPGRSYHCKRCPPGLGRALIFAEDAVFVKDAAQRGSSRVSDVLMGHIDEVHGLILQLGACKDKQQAKRIRSRLRRLGHKGGLS